MSVKSIFDAFDGLFDDVFDGYDEEFYSISFLFMYIMPAKLPESLKSGVIQQWLKGVERDRIALGNGLSAGAVTNIVNEWRQAIDFPVADELRELAVTLKKIGITPGECAIGCRTSMMLNRVGVGNDQLQSFLSDVYKRSVDLGLTPHNIASYLRDLLEFSNTLVFSQIPAYLEQKKQEKDQLRKEGTRNEG